MKSASLFCYALALGGCLADQDMVAEEETAQTQQAAYVSTGRVWGTSLIDFCWEQSAGSFTQEKEVVRQEIESTWTADSAVQFRGWNNDCISYSGDKDLRVLWYDDPNSESRCEGDDWGDTGLGTDLDGDRDGCKLDRGLALDPSLRPAAWAGAAVHEFGHAIALAHEQNRPDAPPECAAMRSGNDGDALVGPYDPTSVMNYCSNAARPSGIDIEAANWFYGAQFSTAAVQVGFEKVVIARSGDWRNNVSTLQTRNFYLPLGNPVPIWSNWTNLGGMALSAPTAVAWNKTNLDRIDVFARGGNRSLVQIARNFGAWSNWADLGGIVVGQPTVVSRGPNQLTVLVRNVQNGLSVREWNGSTWLPWVNIPGNFLGRPAAIATRDGYVWVFVHWTDHSARWLRSSATGTWPGAFQTMGGGMLGSPAAVAVYSIDTSSDWPYVFVRGTYNELYYQYYNGLAWSGWVWLGAPSTSMESSPAVVSRSRGSLDVVVRDGVGQLWTISRREGARNWSYWEALPNASDPLLGTPTLTGWGDEMGVWGSMQATRWLLHLRYATGNGWTTQSLGGPIL